MRTRIMACAAETKSMERRSVQLALQKNEPCKHSLHGSNINKVKS